MPKWQALLLDKLLTVRVFAAHGRKKRSNKNDQGLPDYAGLLVAFFGIKMT
jgi:hypothetical protein